MSRVRVKICGITSLEDLDVAVKAGADAIGIVVDVPQSPRNISISKAKELIEATPIFVDTVAVTVPKDITHLDEINRALKPNFLQVHGLTNMLKKIREKLPDNRLIGAIQVKSCLDTDIIVNNSKYFDAILLDSFVSGKQGGSGVTHDWEISKEIRRVLHPKPLILAGGLSPQNIKEAITTVKPFAVDVSTGVEGSPGKKDRIKVFEFVKSAKEVEL